MAQSTYTLQGKEGTTLRGPGKGDVRKWLSQNVHTWGRWIDEHQGQIAVSSLLKAPLLTQGGAFGEAAQPVIRGEQQRPART